MAKKADSLPFQVVTSETKKSEGIEERYDAREKIESTHTSELVIALCGPIGSPLHEVAQTIKKVLLTEFDYKECEVLKLVNLLREDMKLIVEIKLTLFRLLKELRL